MTACTQSLIQQRVVGGAPIVSLSFAVQNPAEGSRHTRPSLCIQRSDVWLPRSVNVWGHCDALCAMLAVRHPRAAAT